MISRAKETHTTNRVVRLDAEWDELEEVTGPRGRAAIIRQLVQWYLRYPGVKLPQRPARRPSKPDSDVAPGAGHPPGGPGTGS